MSDGENSMSPHSGCLVGGGIVIVSYPFNFTAGK
jgi:hypothetical protein